MVRLEKVAWERLFNTKMLGRERALGAPKKWFEANRHREVKVASFYYFTQGLRASIFRMLEPVMAYFFWKWPRDIALQRGLPIAFRSNISRFGCRRFLDSSRQRAQKRILVRSHPKRKVNKNSACY